MPSRDGTPRPQPTLDIVIVNWNTGPYLRECLRSVAAAHRTAFELAGVTVVDNASTDDSLDGIQETALPLQLLRNAENRGFAAACNQGARAGKADFLLFLNPDTRLFADTLDLSIEFMADPANPTVGICGGQMLGENGAQETSCARFPTLAMFIAMMTGLAHAFPRRFPKQRLAADESNWSGTVDQVIGAYFLMRRRLFEALDGFDERFFVYLEDVDLAYRAKRHGYTSHFLSHVPVRHKARVSSDRVRGRRLFYLLRSRTQYAGKHWPAWQAVVLTAMQLVVELPVRAIAAGARGRRDEAHHIREAACLYSRYVASLVARLWSRLWSRSSPRREAAGP